MNATIKNISTDAVMELTMAVHAEGRKLTEEETQIVGSLYSYASDYGYAKERIVERTAQMRNSMDEVEQGRVFTYSAVQIAQDIETQLEKVRSSEKGFRAICKIAKIEIEEVAE